MGVGVLYFLGLTCQQRPVCQEQPSCTQNDLVKAQIQQRNKLVKGTHSLSLWVCAEPPYHI